MNKPEHLSDLMRCDIILLRLKQTAMDYRINAKSVGKRTAERFSFVASTLEEIVKKLEKELAEVRWIDVK